MLGQPMSMLIPQVIGFKLTGELPEGATATDLVLTVTERLRGHGVVGKFVEFYGAGVAQRAAGRPRDDRQHVARSSARPARSSRSTRRRCATSTFTGRAGRADRARRGLRAARRACGTTSTPRSRPTPTRSSSTSARSCRRSPGPKRPQDRVALTEAQAALPRGARPSYVPDARRRATRRSAETFPARDPTAVEEPANGDGARDRRSPRAARRPAAGGRRARPGRRSRSRSTRRTRPTLDHGDVVIAAITSCTNTSNPSVMLGAGLLARNAVDARARGQAVGEDVARARLEGRHRVLRARRPDRAARGARLQPRRLRLHDLHRQLRPAAGGDLGGGQRGRPRGRLGALAATATSRGASTPT